MQLGVLISSRVIDRFEIIVDNDRCNDFPKTPEESQPVLCVL